MSSTPNYSLSVTTDDTMTFQAWREQMDGAGNSNMMKIDAALAGKADTSRVLQKTLAAALWNKSGDIYTQTIAVDGLTAGQNGLAFFAQDIGTEALKAAARAVLRLTEQAAGMLTFTASGAAPETDIPITLILL